MKKVVITEFFVCIYWIFLEGKKIRSFKKSFAKKISNFFFTNFYNFKLFLKTSFLFSQRKKIFESPFNIPAFLDIVIVNSTLKLFYNRFLSIMRNETFCTLCIDIQQIFRSQINSASSFKFLRSTCLESLKKIRAARKFVVSKVFFCWAMRRRNKINYG